MRQVSAVLVGLAGVTCLASAWPSVAAAAGSKAQDGCRVRARDVGVAPGILSPGKLNAITDVQGVRVGHFTLVQGEHVKSGVTAILPHEGNVFQDRLPAGLFIANGHGKSTGLSQLAELGELETPIVLTNTLAVASALQAVITWTLDKPGNETIRSVNAVVGETNDGQLNDIRGRALRPEHAIAAIEAARSGPVEEGAVGAGAGTIAFGWKGGIGTSSRKLPEGLGGYTVGVLVQSNFGGVLSIDGRRIGEELDNYYLRDELDGGDADGSIMIVLATDAPLSDRNLSRLARRSMAGLARAGASFSNGSGDFAIAFSTAPEVRRTAARRASVTAYPEVSNDNVSPLFQAAAEATEEAIYNSMFMAQTTTSQSMSADQRVTVEQFPIERLTGGRSAACR